MQASIPTKTHKYDAFISYSRADKAFAQALEKALEAYRPPKDIGLPTRHLNVFRDEGDLTGTEYFKAIEAHLQGSAKLIVICSPKARSSEYVDDEIRRFAKIKSSRDIIPILFDGIPNNEADTEDASNLAFPDTLCEVLEMPLATFYKGFQPGKDRIGRGVFEGSWFTILANLYDISRDVLEQREKKRQIHRRRVRMATIGAVMAAITVLAIIAWIQKLEADRQRYASQKQLALNYWDNALREKDAGNFFLSLYLKAKAVTASPDPGLASTIIQNTGEELNAAILSKVYPFKGSEIAFACNGNGYILTEDEDTTQIQLLDAASGAPTGHAFKIELPLGAFVTGFQTGCAPRRLMIKTLDSAKNGGGSVQLLDFESGQTVIHRLASGSFAIDLTSDLKQFLIGTSDGTYQVRAVVDGRDIGPPIQISHPGLISFSDNGKHLVAKGWDGIVRLFEVQTGQQIKEDFTHENQKIFDAVLSPHGRRLVTWDSDKGLRIWDLKGSGARSLSVSSEQEIHGARFSSKGAFLLIWDASHRAYIINPVNGKIIAANMTHSHGKPMFSPNDQFVMTFTKESSFLWETLTGRQIGGLFHPPQPLAVFVDDGRRLFTLDDDHFVRWWDLSDIESRYRVVRPSGGIVSAQWSAGAQEVLTMSRLGGTHVERWHADTGRRSKDGFSYRSLADGLVFSAQTHRLLLWGRRRGKEYFADLIDYEQHKLIKALSVNSKIEGALLSPNHSLLFMWMADGTATLWQFYTGKPVESAAIQGRVIIGGAFAPDNRHLIVWTKDGKAVLWDVNTGFKKAEPFSPRLPVHGAAWSSKQNFLLTWNQDGTACLWQQPDSHTDGIVFQHGSEVQGGVFDERTGQVLTWSADHVVHFWDMSGNETTIPAKGPITGLSLSPDQKRILTWSASYPGEAILWDVASGKELGRYEQQHMRGCLGFSVDQKNVVTYDRKEIRFWRLPGDLDYPSEAFSLKVEALTGSRFHVPTYSVRLMPYDEWLNVRQVYLERDREHAQTCAYPHQNAYLKYFAADRLQRP